MITVEQQRTVLVAVLEAEIGLCKNMIAEYDTIINLELLKILQQSLAEVRSATDLESVRDGYKRHRLKMLLLMETEERRA
jgi:hypothetical protein